MGAGSTVCLQQRVASACLEVLTKKEIPIYQYDSTSSLSASVQLFRAIPTTKFCSSESMFFLAAVFNICCRNNEFRKLSSLRSSHLDCCGILLEAIKQNIPQCPKARKRFYSESLMLSNNKKVANINAVAHLSDWVETEIRSFSSSAAMSIHDSELDNIINNFDSSMEDLLLYFEVMSFGVAITSLDQKPEFPIIYANEALAATFTTIDSDGRSELLGKSYLFPIASTFNNEEQMAMLTEAMAASKSARISFRSEDGRVERLVILEPLRIITGSAYKHMIHFYLDVPDTDIQPLENLIDEFVLAFRQTLNRGSAFMI